MFSTTTHSVVSPTAGRPSFCPPPDVSVSLPLSVSLSAPPVGIWDVYDSPTCT